MSSRALFCSIFFLLSLTYCVKCVDVNILLNGLLEYHDLSHPFDNQTVYWPGNRKFSFTKKYAGVNPKGIWYSANEFCAAEHGGTHLDAPYHFDKNGWSVGQIPFENLVASLHVIDLSTIVAGNPDFILEKHHMDNLFYLDPKKKHVIIFNFGWSQHYGNIKYFGTNNPMTNNLKFPGLGEEVSNWIASSSPSLVGVGVDVPSVDPGSEETSYPAHRAFATRGVYILENVKLDTPLPRDGCAVMVMPMKIQDGTGAPVRVTAICPKINVF